MCGGMGKARNCRKFNILRLPWFLNPHSFMSITNSFISLIIFYWYFYNDFLKCQNIRFSGNIKLMIHKRLKNNILDYFNVFRYKITRQCVHVKERICKNNEACVLAYLIDQSKRLSTRYCCSKRSNHYPC